MAAAIFSGALAGLAVDLSLFPIDTIKTRLQSEGGFMKAGGFRGIYSGFSSVALGSAPGAALFFLTYEATKHHFNLLTNINTSVVHMVASSIAEVVACLVRVPTEVVKQRSQAQQGPALRVAKQIITAEGLRGFYRGYVPTVLREIPFSVIQFPLWELLKVKTSAGEEIEPWKSAVCGAIAGSVAAFITTPLDVAKTRIMLAEKTNPTASHGTLTVLRAVYTAQGIGGLWSGVVPRVIWISIGGFVFLGVYDWSRHQFMERNRFL